MGHFVYLNSGRFEQNCRAHAAVDVAERPLGVHIQGFGVRQRPGEVRFDGDVEPRLAQLAENDGAELRHVQWRRSQRDQRLPPRLLEMFSSRPGYPLGQHRQGAAGLLELG